MFDTRALNMFPSEMFAYPPDKQPKERDESNSPSGQQ
jgi:hypothetical protein